MQLDFKVHLSRSPLSSQGMRKSYSPLFSMCFWLLRMGWTVSGWYSMTILLKPITAPTLRVSPLPRVNSYS